MADKYRLERVERLLHELEYEITRGMMEGDLPEETMGFRFVVPVSKVFPDGGVKCTFDTRPIPRTEMLFGMEQKPKLTIVR